MKGKKRTEQVVVRIKGTYSLVEELLHVVEQRTNGTYSKVMPSDNGAFHAICTVFEVFEE